MTRQGTQSNRSDNDGPTPMVRKETCSPTVKTYYLLFQNSENTILKSLRAKEHIDVQKNMYLAVKRRWIFEVKLLYQLQ